MYDSGWVATIVDGVVILTASRMGLARKSRRLVDNDENVE